jgi:hypothetical protein
MKSASETGETPRDDSPFDHAAGARNTAFLIAAQLPQ